jgi:hypothetical protein
MTFDEKVVEEFRRKVYAKKVKEFVEAFEEAYDKMAWLEDYQYCLDDAGKKLLNYIIDNMIRVNDFLDEFYLYFNEYLTMDKERDGSGD